MHPVGPLDPKVYWVRRVAVIGLAVLLLVGLVWFVVAKARSSAASGPEPAADSAVVSSTAGLTGVLATSSYPATVSSTTTTTSSATSAPATTRSVATTSAPKTTAPKTTAPKTTAPKTTAPKTTAPKTTAPKTTAPKTTPATSAKPSSTTPKPSTTAPRPTTTAPSTNAQGQLICPDSSMKLVTTLGSPSYPSGGLPILGVTVSNVGSQACSRDVSGSLQVFTAYDAAGKRIWSTVDCFPGSGTDVRYLQPGDSLQYNIKWSGTTSQPGCAGDRLTVPPGTYTIVASIGSLKGTPATLTLT